jgi:hypothetical protein
VDPGLEELGGTLPARIRTTLGHLRDVLTVPGVELRFHNVHLYNAIYRFDDEMIVTPYLYRAHGFQHPAFRLRRLGPYGVFASFADQFETIWATATTSVIRSSNVIGSPVGPVVRSQYVSASETHDSSRL